MDEPREIGRQIEAMIGAQCCFHRREARRPIRQRVTEIRPSLRQGPHFNVGHRPHNKHILAAGSQVHGRWHPVADIHPPDRESR